MHENIGRRGQVRDSESHPATAIPYDAHDRFGVPPFMQKLISIRGAREHNLQGVDLDIPRDRLVVITGLSGSGKSSLAFDTIYAEGQRRYVESLSAYARQFLELMQKPDCRVDRRSLARDLDRAENDLAQSALHRRHGHRGLRLPSTPPTPASVSPTHPPPACPSRARPSARW